MHIGQKISEILNEKKVKVSSLSEYLGLSKQGVYQLLKKSSIDTAQLEKIAQFISVPTSCFFESSEKDKSELLDFVVRSLDSAWYESLFLGFFDATMKRVIINDSELKSKLQEILKSKNVWEKIRGEGETQTAPFIVDLFYEIKKFNPKYRKELDGTFKRIQDVFIDAVFDYPAIVLLIKKGIIRERDILKMIPSFLLLIGFPGSQETLRIDKELTKKPYKSA